MARSAARSTVQCSLHLIQGKLIWTKFAAVEQQLKANHSSPNLIQSRTYNQLISTWDEYFEFHEKDTRVKIAVLDTGFDSKHRDWDNPRAIPATLNSGIGSKNSDISAEAAMERRVME